MKVSLKWLSKYIDISDLSVNELAEVVTRSGVEIEEIEELSNGSNLVIGQVIECVDHPESDHLHVCKVDIGDEILQIVCGAPNCRQGLKVIVAKVGAKLEAIKVNITKGVIRGIESCGMLCSLLELGVNEKYLSDYQKAGIEELPEDAPVGHNDPLDYLGLKDTIFLLKPTPNRGDVLSLYSFALEVGAVLNRKVLPLEEVVLEETVENSHSVSSQTEKCGLFTCREVYDIEIKESPKWMQEYLLASGMRPINNVVDIGNIVMILTGQPLHMYDMDKLSSKSFIVKDNMEGEFVALDEVKHDLIAGDLTVNIGEDHVGCLAGVMGSKSTMIDENTKNVVIEAAIFDSTAIRLTSRRLQLISEASQRYVRGLDVNRTEYASSLAASLLVEYASAKKVSNLVKYDVLDHNEKEVLVTINKINKLLGTSYTNEDLSEVLTRLGFKFNVINDEYSVVVPTYRRDVTIWQDIAEEVIRLKGFDDLPMTLPGNIKMGFLTKTQQNRKLIREFLVDNGLTETLNYVLDARKYDGDFNVFNNDESISLLSPMTEERAVLRKSVMPSLLHTVNYNQSRKVNEVAIYEVSNVYTQKGEYERLGIALTQKGSETRWLKGKDNDFYTIKGIVMSIFNLLGIDENRYSLERVEDSNKFYHPGRSCYILMGKKKIGVIGQIHPLMEKKYDVTTCFVAELDLATILDIKTNKIKFEEPSLYPSITRDIALVCKLDLLSSNIIKVIRKNAKGIVNSVEVFDEYHGEHMQPGYKSVALTITYGSKDHTLKDDEITPVHQNILLALEKELGIELRK